MFSVQFINHVCEAQKMPALPLTLDAGTFHYVRTVEGINIYAFSFINLKGCKPSTNSTMHRQWRPLKLEEINNTALLQYADQAGSGVGAIVNQAEELKVERAELRNGVVVGEYQMKRASGLEKTEADIQVEINDHLNETFDSNTKSKVIKPQQQDRRHMCPF